jgi:hypothetical protein
MSLFTAGISAADVARALDSILQDLAAAQSPEGPDASSRSEPTIGIAYKALIEQFGDPLTKGQLFCIADLLHRRLPDDLPELDREEKRNRNRLVDWFEFHWAKIEPVIAEIHEVQ